MFVDKAENNTYTAYGVGNEGIVSVQQFNRHTIFRYMIVWWGVSHDTSCNVMRKFVIFKLGDDKIWYSNNQKEGLESNGLDYYKSIKDRYLSLEAEDLSKMKGCIDTHK